MVHTGLRGYVAEGCRSEFRGTICQFFFYSSIQNEFCDFLWFFGNKVRLCVIENV